MDALQAFLQQGTAVVESFGEWARRQTMAHRAYTDSIRRLRPAEKLWQALVFRADLDPDDGSVVTQSDPIRTWSDERFVIRKIGMSANVPPYTTVTTAAFGAQAPFNVSNLSLVRVNLQDGASQRLVFDSDWTMQQFANETGWKSPQSLGEHAIYIAEPSTSLAMILRVNTANWAGITMPASDDTVRIVLTLLGESIKL
ncbi:MAG: hypothetical protein UY96_C0010G0010 [Parcubacteria group bacterium GW2011_GWB1_56_8]|nr:MAG: hypothetical protein UY96_C0010G0010 [Parcubacteria group bacterium GW2011_GWB1_56_8]